MRKLICYVIIALLQVSMLTLAFNIRLVKALPVYTIPPGGGSPDPAIKFTSPKTYDFINNLQGQLVVEQGGAIINGHGFTLSGDGTSGTTGLKVDITSGGDVFIQNDLRITNFDVGILLDRCSSNRITDCKLWSNNLHGISLSWSSYNVIERNNVTLNGANGIFLLHSSFDNITDNEVDTNTQNGMLLEESIRNRILRNNVTDNIENGICLKHSSNNNTIGEFGAARNIILTNDDNGILVYDSRWNVMEYNNITSNTDNGIYLWYSSNNTITASNQIWWNSNGVFLYQSSWNNITKNMIIQNNQNGVYLNSSRWNRIEISNGIWENGGNGIELDYSSNNTLTDWNQVLRNTEHGIYLFRSPWNNISRHYIYDNHWDGIFLSESSWNNLGDWLRIRNNGICAIELSSSSNNNIFENDIFDMPGVLHQSYGIFLHDKSENNAITRHNELHYIKDQLIAEIWLQSSNNIVADNDIFSTSPNGLGIYFTHDASSNVISTNNITNNAYGIRLDSGSDNKISGNNITSNIEYGIGIAFYAHDNTVSFNNLTENKLGIYLYYASIGNIIHSNNVSANSILDGIIIENTSYSFIFFNNVSSNGNNGILLIGSAWNSIVTNLIRDNVNDGIRLESSSNNNAILHNGISNSQNGIHESLSSSSPGNSYLINSFSGNTVDMNLADSSLSLSDISGKSDNGSGNSCGDVVAGNTIADATYGIYIHGSSNFTIYNNNIENNAETGIVLESSSNKIYHNNFINNTRHASVTLGNSNTWDNGYPFGGNYWDNYTGEDLNGDGIGEQPYVIDENDIDNVVLIQPYVPDVAVTDVEPIRIVVGQGYTTNINVTMANQGNYMENLNFTIYANGTAIGSQALTLARWTSTIITLTWNTIGFAKGSYITTAAADEVPGETDLMDNNCTDGLILIAKVGDLGGGLPPQFFKCDDKVDGIDLALFIACYKGLAPPEAMQLADLGGGLPPKFYQCDGKVDGIDLALFIACYKGLGPPDP